MCILVIYVIIVRFQLCSDFFDCRDKSKTPEAHCTVPRKTMMGK